MKKIFEGVCTALVTPFENNKIDYKSLQRLIEKQITDGACAICLLGTTGESCCIENHEREKIIKFSKKIINGRCKLIVGTGSNNFVKAYKYTKMAKSLGADGALVVTPYYNKTSKKGLVEYYKKLATIGLPIIVYNVPGRTGVNIELDTLKSLIKIDNIYGIKEATNNIDRIIDLCKICKNKIAVYSGEDKLNFLFYALGADGCISVTANAFCSRVKEVYELSKKQKIKKANKLQSALNSINEILFCETNPIPIKYVLSKMNLIKNELRLPLIPLSKINEKRVDKAVKNYSKKSN